MITNSKKYFTSTMVTITIIIRTVITSRINNLIVTRSMIISITDIITTEG